MKSVFEKIIEKLEDYKYLYLVERDSEISQHCKDVVDCEGMDCSLCVFDKAIEIVKQEAGQYNNGWIPCSERLPEKNGMYICTQNSYDLETNKNIIRVSTELVEFYNGKWRRAKTLVVTHWQPLPQPYTKGE